MTIVPPPNMEFGNVKSIEKKVIDFQVLMYECFVLVLCVCNLSAICLCPSCLVSSNSQFKMYDPTSTSNQSNNAKCRCSLASLNIRNKQQNHKR